MATIDRAIQQMILDNKSSDEIKWQAINSGELTTLGQNAAHKVANRQITYEELVGSGLYSV